MRWYTGPIVQRLVLLLAVLAASRARAGEGPFDAPGFPVTAEAAPAARAVRTASVPLTIRAYRAAGRFQGARCAHRPSCSAYAAEALHRHGPVLGSFVGVARLLRGARSSALRPLARDGRGALLDPLEASTFFLGAAPP
jgi:putative component of membrane protein insertase Oxa1/YidC/SpoIIIJ protein YidD